jgi:hypothetical protein
LGWIDVTKLSCCSDYFLANDAMHPVERGRRRRAKGFRAAAMTRPAVSRAYGDGAGVPTISRHSLYVIIT